MRINRAAVKRYWAVIALGVLLSVGVGVWGVSSQVPVYTTTAIVLIDERFSTPAVAIALLGQGKALSSPEDRLVRFIVEGATWEGSAQAAGQQVEILRQTVDATLPDYEALYQATMLAYRQLQGTVGVDGGFLLEDAYRYQGLARDSAQAVRLLALNTTRAGSGIGKGVFPGLGVAVLFLTLSYLLGMWCFSEDKRLSEQGA